MGFVWDSLATPGRPATIDFSWAGTDGRLLASRGARGPPGGASMAMTATECLRDHMIRKKGWFIGSKAKLDYWLLLRILRLQLLGLEWWSHLADPVLWDFPGTFEFFFSRIDLNMSCVYNIYIYISSSRIINMIWEITIIMSWGTCTRGFTNPGWSCWAWPIITPQGIPWSMEEWPTEK